MQKNEVNTFILDHHPLQIEKKNYQVLLVCVVCNNITYSVCDNRVCCSKVCLITVRGSNFKITTTDYKIFPKRVDLNWC